MTAPIVPLEVMQAGIEATRGTLVAATHKVDFTPGTAVLKRDIKIERIRNSGSLATSHRSYTGPEFAEITYNAPASYDRMPVYGNLFLGPLSSGTGAGANKLWTFGSSVISDSSDTLKSYSFEVGGNDTWPTEFKVAGCMGKSLEIDIKNGAVWQLKVDLLGMITTQASKTGALTFPTTLVDSRYVDTTVYVDASTIHTTALSGVLVSGHIKIENKLGLRYTGAGSTPFRIAVLGRTVTFDLIIEYAATTEYTAWAADTPRKISYEAVGAVLGTDFYRNRFDIYGTWSTLAIGSDADVKTLQLSGEAQYDSGAAVDIGAAFTNSLAALP